MRTANQLRRLSAAMLCGLLAGLSLAGQEKAQKTKNRKEAEKLVSLGDAALARGQALEALADFDEAGEAAPNDLAIAGRRAALRSKLVQQHVDAAEQAAIQGDLTAAKRELRAGLKIDPTNTVIAERLREMQWMQGDETLAGEKVKQSQLAGVPELHPQKGVKNFDVRGDTRTAYEEVALAFGVTVSFDPDLIARPVRLRVQNVDFKTAMQLLGDICGTFWRALDSDRIFVAADTTQKRREFAIQAEQTFVLPSAVETSDMTEILRALREISGATHIQVDLKTRSITVRDTPTGLKLAKELIEQMDRGRGELMLDIDMLEVDNNTARNLGITPPSGAQAISLSKADIQQLQQATTVQNLLTILQGILTAQGITTPATQFVPVGGGNSTFLLNLPSATANFSQALSLVRSGQRMLLRAQNGKPATFFLGTRFPVTLSLLSASLGGTAVGGSVTGTTFARTDFTVGQTPTGIVAEDFNNDLQKDLATANQGDSTISVLLNQGNGNFIQAPNSPFTLGANEQGPTGIASGTFRLTDATHLVQPADLVVANSTSNTVSVLLGNNDGTFSEAQGSPFSVGAQPRAVVVADFNQDGIPDFAVANTGDSSISIFQGKGDGTFVQFPGSPFQLPAGQQGPVAMVEGNFRDATTPGLAVVNVTSNNVSILEALGGTNFNGVFTEETGSPIGVGSLPVAIATGDVNADGFSDLAVVNQNDNSVSILANNGDGTFAEAEGSPLPTASLPSGVAIADFTADGLGDIAVTNNGVNTLGVYLGLGSGLFSQRLELSTAAGPTAVTATDLSGDGLPDVALTAHSTGTNQVTVLLDPTGIASSSVAQVPFPGSEYIDLGVKVEATPVMNGDDAVTLKLKLEIRSLAGSSFNGIPVITNRTLEQTVRLKQDETSVVSGLLDRQETKTLSGLPGLAQLPLGLGYAFGTRNNTGEDSQFLIMVTPRRLRLPERNTRTILAGPGNTFLGGTSSSPALRPEGFVPGQSPQQQPQQPEENSPEQPTTPQTPPEPQENRPPRG